MQAFEKFLDGTSLLLLAAIVSAGLFAATELGYRIHLRHLKKLESADATKPESSFPIFGAALGLLALILGFSFSMALERYDLRRTLVLDEANAIGTVELRSRLIASPGREEMAQAVRQYLDVRLEYFAAAGDPAKEQAARRHTIAMQDKLWQVMSRGIETHEQNPLTSLLVSSVNDAFDLATSRRAAFTSHIPASVLGMVLLYALICASLLGYALADTRRRHLAMSSLLLLLLSLVVTVIVDIDRPRVGSVVVSVAPLEELREAMANQAQQ